MNNMLKKVSKITLIRSNSFVTLMTLKKGFGQVPSGPSIDALAKTQQLEKLLTQYRGASTKSRVFDDRLQFPTNFVLKIIGDNQPTFIPDVLQILATCLSCESSSISYTTKPSGQGSFISISVNPVFQSSDQLYATYDALSKDPRIKYVF
jgi:putative lipoic acid-binding regulatory protein